MIDGSPWILLPEARRERANALCRDAIGAIDRLSPLSGRASGAMLFRADRGERSFVLRIEGEPSPLRNPNQYESMRIAAEAGIAPPVLAIDEADRIAITAFVAHRPIGDFPGGTAALIAAVGAMLRSLQAAPTFPYFIDYPAIVARLLAHVVRTGLFAEGLLDPHVERLARISEALAQLDDGERVSSHNDCHAGNLLFDGRRLWLIDWESACRNDPLVDVATMLDNGVDPGGHEDGLLHAWLGRAPGRALIERLAPIRALVRLYYAGVLLSASAAAGRAAPDDDLAVPPAAQFPFAGERSPAAVHLLGKMYLAGFMDGRAVPPLAVI